MKYKKGFKYQLYKDEVFLTGIPCGKRIKTQFIHMDETGKLTVLSGYAWDGPSGPTIDRKTNMRGSLAHDALYQLIRNKWLEPHWRLKADKFMQQCCVEDGMNKLWAKLYKRELSKFASFAADPANAKKVYEAP